MSPSLILFTTSLSIIQDFEDNEDVTSFPDFDDDSEAVSAVTGEDL